MRYLSFLIVVLFCCTSTDAQTYEIGGFIGGSNLIGDVGNSAYINPNALAIGGIFRWNRSERHSFRFSAIIAKLEGDDANSGEQRRQERDYSFENRISELSVGMEYTFWEFNLNSGNPASAPYIYTGITYLFYFDNFFADNLGKQTNFDQGRALAIPIALGYKLTLGTNILGSIEIGARYAFTDNLDGSNPVNASGDVDRAFGNINNNDWYVFTGMTFSFTFGRQPCYCNF
ncbi:MAG: hypothetical protein ACJA1Z_002335 [Patiriisocius sp.]|jgi:hypothetical protein